MEEKAFYETIEILAGNLDIALKELGFNAIKKYEEKTSSEFKHQVWEVSGEDFKKLCNIADTDWMDEWGWWRYAKGSNVDNPLADYIINGHKITAWDGDNRIEADKAEDEDDKYLFEREYNNLLGYFCDELGASQPRNVCALAVDLAKINNMRLSELFQKYQG